MRFGDQGRQAMAQNPKAAAKRPTRPQLLRLTPEMQHYCALLTAELAGWQGLIQKPMFGFIAFYRGRTIFAAVPKSRALGTSRSVLFKLPPDAKARKRLSRDERVLAETEQGRFKNWFPFEIRDKNDLRGALEWLAEAYEAAG